MGDWCNCQFSWCGDAQYRAASQSVKFGVAVQLDFRVLGEESLKSAILEVLTNPSYAKNAKKISQNFQE
jgi:UDP:flavonoid glycosyltransferase YjiC (YdhE family)